MDGDIFACEENRFCLCLRLLDFRTVQQCGFILLHNSIGGATVSVLTSSVVDRVVKSMIEKLVFVSSPLSTQH